MKSFRVRSRTVAEGIVTGARTLSPDVPAARAQAAVVLTRFLEEYRLNG